MERGYKKLCWHTTLGQISVAEPQYRKGSKRIRAFAQSAKVSHRGCSRPLQRAVTDFGADVPFAQAMDKLVEHYGVVLAESTIRASPRDMRRPYLRRQNSMKRGPRKPGMRN